MNTHEKCLVHAAFYGTKPLLKYPSFFEPSLMLPRRFSFLVLAIAYVVTPLVSASARKFEEVVVDAGAGKVGPTVVKMLVAAGAPSYFAVDQKGRLIFSRNSSSDGAGSWATQELDGSGREELIILTSGIVNGRPTVVYQDDFAVPDAVAAPGEDAVEQDAPLHILQSTAPDGNGPWVDRVVTVKGHIYGNAGDIRVIGGKLAFSFNNFADGYYAENSAPDGSGTWTITRVGAGGWQASSLAELDRRPAIAFTTQSDQHLNLTRKAANGAWAEIVVDDSAGFGPFVALRVVGGRPFIAYYESTNTDGELKLARNFEADGSGPWSASYVDTAEDVGSGLSFEILNGIPTLSYVVLHADGRQGLKYTQNTMPDASGTWITKEIDDSGTVSGWTSLITLNGLPAVGYYNGASRTARLAINSKGDATGTWAIREITGALPGSIAGQFLSAAKIAGVPAMAYTAISSEQGVALMYARNTQADGHGTWVRSVVDVATGLRANINYTSLAEVDGRPAIAYYKLNPLASLWELKFAINSAPDGSGTWTVSTVASDSERSFLAYLALAVTAGKPSIVYDYSKPQGSVTRQVRFARNSAADGRGTWTNTVVTPESNRAGNVVELAQVKGQPAVVYFDRTLPGRLVFARNTDIDNGGTWVKTTISSDFVLPFTFPRISLILSAGRPAVTYQDLNTREVLFARSPEEDGSGVWTSTTVTEAPLGQISLAVVNGKPAMVVDALDESGPLYLESSNADGNGPWTPLSTAAGRIPLLLSAAGLPSRALMDLDGRPGIASYDLLKNNARFFLYGDATISLSSGGSPVLNGTATDFGFVGIGTTKSAEIVISNTGDVALKVSSLQFSGDGAADFSTDPVAPFFVPADQQRTLKVYYHPSASGARSATLTLVSDATTGGTYSLLFYGEAGAIPNVYVPGPITVEATSATGAAVTYAAFGIDDEDGSLVPEGSPASGTVFPIGATPVEVTVTDSDGLKVTASFTVTVRDTTAPTITQIANLPGLSIGSNGSVVVPDFRGSFSVQDAVGPITETQYPTPGVLLGAGVHAVVIVARDGAGNERSISVPLNVAQGLVANNDQAFATSKPIVIDVLANDRDAFPGLLNLQSVTPASGGTAAIVAGKIRFTPSGTLTAPAAFSYTVEHFGFTSTAQVTVSPASAASGTFTGLLFTEDEKPAGLLTVTVGPTGAGSGTLKTGAKTLRFRMDLTKGAVSLVLAPKQIATLTLSLGDTDAQNRPLLNASLTSKVAGLSAAGVVESAPFSTKNPFPFAGQYTSIAQVETPASATAPRIALVSSVKITAAGLATVQGYTGEAVRFTHSGNLTSDGRLPFFFGTGTKSVQQLAGTLRFPGDSEDAGGELRWLVPAGSARFPVAQDATFPVITRPYTAAKRGDAMLALSANRRVDATITTASLNNGNPTVFPLTAKGNLLLPTPKVTLTPASGFFSGTYIGRKFFGVVLQGDGFNRGSAVLLEPNAFGDLTLTVPPGQ